MMIENIAQTLRDTANLLESRAAVTEAISGRTCSFRELDSYVDRYGEHLRTKGVNTGHRVILMVRPSIDFIALAFSLFRIGAPVILIDPGMGYKNLLRCIQSVKPDFLIGIPAVVGLSLIFYSKFRTVKKRFCCGSFLGLTKFDIRKALKKEAAHCESFIPDETSLAAIIFTTGSTGPPKGVRFEHSIFAAQLEKVKSFYKIGKEDVDQPGFPLFALFSTALGAHAVIPDMDPTQPAEVSPQKFVHSIHKYQVTYSFGSPAIWQVVSNYCKQNNVRLRSLKKVLMAGAPVSGDLILQLYDIIAPNGEIHTPYGATESLPIVSFEGREIVAETWEQTRKGKGTCVGKSLPGVWLKIIEATDFDLSDISDCTILASGQIGEIIVKGDVVTRGYDGNEPQNSASKIKDKDGFWHRIGDVGYIDDLDRLWFCGRKAHRVFSRQGVMFTICCEALINNHPDVFRSALVGISTEPEYQIPVIIVELHKHHSRSEKAILAEVRDICAANSQLANVEHILAHQSFPVDIRHNAKIFREKLAAWAGKKILGQ